MINLADCEMNHMNFTCFVLPFILQHSSIQNMLTLFILYAYAVYVYVSVLHYSFSGYKLLKNCV